MEASGAWAAPWLARGSDPRPREAVGGRAPADFVCPVTFAAGDSRNERRMRHVKFCSRSAATPSEGADLTEGWRLNFSDYNVGYNPMLAERSMTA